MDARLDDRRRPRSSPTAAWTSSPPTPLGRALHSPLFDDPRAAGRTSPGSSSSTRGRATSTPDWEGAANITVALLRAEAGRHPHDAQLRELVGELSTLSEEFRTRWAAHNVRIHHDGAKPFHHPVVGALDLGYHTLDLPAEDRPWPAG